MLPGRILCVDDEELGLLVRKMTLEAFPCCCSDAFAMNRLSSQVADGGADFRFPSGDAASGLNTGLGLWITHGIVVKHGGHIDVASKDSGADHGTTFRLLFPKLGVEARSG